MLERTPPVLLFLVAGLSQYAGAAVAVSLFAVIPAPTVAFLRVALAAVVLLAVARPWQQPWSVAELRGAALFGACLATMNVTFYLAIDRIPLGTAVAIEFLGPVAVAAATGRGWSERLAVILALAGVFLLAGATLGSADPDALPGLLAIAAAAASWAAYILLGRRVAARPGVAGLALGMAAGALLYAPFFVGSARLAFATPTRAAAVLGVALLSSVLPYALEQVVLRRLPPARFAILLSLLPATATVTGAVVLRQIPGITDLVGMVLVSAAVVLANRPERDPAGTR